MRAIALKALAAFFSISAVQSFVASRAFADPALDQARSAAQLDKMMSVAEEMKLDKNQEKIFWQLYNRYQRDLQQLGDKRIRLIRDAKQEAADLTDAQATDLIRRALALEETRLAIKRRHVALFLEKLPPRIVARYFQMENKIQTEIDSQVAERMPLVGE